MPGQLLSLQRPYFSYSSHNLQFKSSDASSSFFLFRSLTLPPTCTHFSQIFPHTFVLPCSFRIFGGCFTLPPFQHYHCFIVRCLFPPLFYISSKPFMPPLPISPSVSCSPPSPPPHFPPEIEFGFFLINLCCIGRPSRTFSFCFLRVCCGSFFPEFSFPPDNIVFFLHFDSKQFSHPSF